MNGAVFKTVSETVRTGSGRFDSYTPPPDDCGLRISDCGLAGRLRTSDCRVPAIPQSAIPNLEIDEVAVDSDDFKKRTRAFALRIIRLAESLPDTPTARVIKGQMLRSGTSVGANYRAACRAKSKPDFISKMGTVEEEADETIYWMELLTDAEIVKRARIANLLTEADEIVSMVVTSIKTARGYKRPIRTPQSEIRNHDA